jgi:hypothetical protein
MKATAIAARDFGRWVTAWDGIQASMPGLAPFLQSRFLIPLIEHFGTGSELVVVGDNLATIVNRTAPGIWTTFQPSQLPLGPLVVRPGTGWTDVRAAVVAAVKGPVASLGFTQMDPALIDRPPAAPGVIDYIDTAWVDVDCSFDAYWAGRGKNLRHNMRKQRSRLAENGIRTRLDCIADPAGVAAAIDDYGRLEAAGWKGEIGTAVRADNAQGAFYRAMLESFARAGKGRIWRYWFDAKPVAVDLCIESDDTLVILKTTYAEDEKQYSPAFLMREEYFRPLFDGGRLRRIEFFGRRMEWHQRWTDNVRTLYHANFDQWAWVSWIRRLRSRAAQPQQPAA